MDFVQIFQKLGSPKGVIHIGPQLFYIRKVYLYLGLTNTIWIEPNPFFYDLGLKVISDQERLFNLTIGTKPTIFSVFVNNEEMISESKPYTTITNLFNDNNLDLSSYDFLYIGSQGTFDINLDDLDVDKFKYVAIEVSESFDINSTTDISNIHKHMTKLRYKRVAKSIKTNLGIVFYVKKRKYNKK